MKSKLLFIYLFFFVSICSANNIQVFNVSIPSQNAALDYSMIKYDISWENSWRTSNLESNWDAAWIFVKFRKRTSLAWEHATLNSTGHISPTGSVITPAAFGTGVFMYRSANGIGNISWNNAQLRWNYGMDGVQDFDSVELCVFAIEMVYIPQGAFYAGDGSTTLISGQFQGVGGPFLISSEAALILGGTALGNLKNNNGVGQADLDDFSSSSTQNLLAAFPKGYNAFYIMKYEISQEQYAGFLNKLTWAQQTIRANGNPGASAGIGALNNSNRNGIDIQVPGVPLTHNAIFGCNLDGDGIFNEPDDGQNIACNYLSIKDWLAYLSWSGLRPFTELEYEKACRGATINSIADEYAWGSDFVTGATTIINTGANNEAAGNTGANCVYDNALSVLGPMRVGCFALNTNRQNAGASYYGVMNLSGNVAEWAISVGNVDGRTFSGYNGGGGLTSSGEFSVLSWPNSSFSSPFILKGGDWLRSNKSLRVSDRESIATILATTRVNFIGGRGCRTAP